METTYQVATRSEGGKPKLVTVADISDVASASLPTIVLARLPYQAQPNGLPVKGELDRVAKIEDRLIAALEPSGAFHLGHITFDGNMTVAFGAKKPAPDTVELKIGLFNKQKVTLESRLDPDWTWFKSEMQLSAEEEEIGRNHGLLDVLAREGDNPSKPRPVDFAAKFPTEEKREAFIRDMAQVGYEPSEQGRWTPEDPPIEYWCELVAVTTVEPSAIAARCAFLRAKARQHGGEFDGWACPVTP